MKKNYVTPSTQVYHTTVDDILTPHSIPPGWQKNPHNPHNPEHDEEGSHKFLWDEE